jgi:hypothetical protein
MRTMEVLPKGTNCGTSLIESYGQVFPELLIEAVGDAKHPGRLSLESWNGRRSRTGLKVRYQDLWHVPGSINTGLARAIRFSPPSRPFGSVVNLISAMRPVFSRYAGTPVEVASVLAAFSLASWVVDCLPLAPTLTWLAQMANAL